MHQKKINLTQLTVSKVWRFLNTKKYPGGASIHRIDESFPLKTSLTWLLWSVWIPPQLKTAASTLEQESMFWAERGRSERDLLRQCAAAPNSESHWLPDSQRRYSNSARFSSKQRQSLQSLKEKSKTKPN